MRKTARSLLSILVVLIPALAQNTQQGTTAQQEASDEVVRITSQIVQTDVVVLDKRDQPVNDLKASDFELYENGKRQKIQSAELVEAGAPRRAESQAKGDTGGAQSAPPPAQERGVNNEPAAAEVNRYIAFVIDDLTIPFEDFENVRKTLLDFVDNKMASGQVVAILRSSGGKGLLQQFTSDRQLLRKTISELTPKLHPLNSNNNPDDKPRFVSIAGTTIDLDAGGFSVGKNTDETTLATRARLTLSVANFVIESLKLAPGRKDLVLLSGGLPVLGANAQPASILDDVLIRGDVTSTATQPSASNDVSALIRRMTDNAARAGVVVSTMYVRGLTGARGVTSFRDTPGRSALGADADGSIGFGRSPDASRLGDNKPFDSMDAKLGLSSLADATGGVSVANTNNFSEGLDRVLARGRVYYLLTYTPAEKFDNTFHKIQVKVNRPDLKIYARAGFYAMENAPWSSLTKEELVLRAAASPVARRGLDLASYLQIKFLPNKRAALDIKLAVDASRISFKQGADGKYVAALDLVGLVYDEFGKLKGGLSVPGTVTLTPEGYRRAVASGWEAGGSTELTPGAYQLRAAVRDPVTGATGVLEKFFEIPNIGDGELGLSTIFLYEAEPPPAKTTPLPLTAMRTISRQRDLRYATVVYNPKLDGGKYQLRVQTVISQDDKVVYEGPERLLEGSAEINSPQVVALDQLNLARVQPGRYVLTLRVTDSLSKKSRVVSQSIDFTVGG